MATLSIYSGDGQVSAPGWPTASPLRVYLESGGLPVAGATITWTLSSAGLNDRVYPLTSVTDAGGIAETTYYGDSMIQAATSWISATITASTPSASSVNLYATTTTKTLTGWTVWPVVTLLKPEPALRALVGQPTATITGAVKVTVVAFTGTKGGQGIPNVGVTIEGGDPLTEPTASVAGGTGLTDSSGLISDVTFGAVSGGPVQVTINVGGFASYPISLTVGADFSGISILSGNNQGGNPSTDLEQPLVVQVLNADGTPNSGAAVAWSIVTPGSMTFISTTTTTNFDGKAQATITLGATPGVYDVWATFGVDTVAFTVYINDPAAVKTIGIVSGGVQSAQVSTAFGNPLVVEVLDGALVPVPGETVSFFASGVAVTLSSPTAATAANGQASITVTAGTVPGAVRVLASITAGDSTAFSLNVVSAPTPPAPDTQYDDTSELSFSGALAITVIAPTVAPTTPVDPVPTTTMAWTPIAAVNVPRALLPSNVHSGPFLIGGALYAVLNRDPIAGPFTNRVYKSGDSGATWTEMDGANRPVDIFHSSVYYPGSGTTIYFAYFDQTLQLLRIKNFDTTTDAWQVEIGGGPAIGSMLYMTVLASGDYVFEFGVFNVSILDCYYVIYSGGWGAATLISSVAERSTPAGIVLDAADLVHFFYVLATTKQLRHVGLPSGGVLGAGQAVATVKGQYTVGVGVIWNSKVVFPFADAAGNPAVAYGTPSGSAAPVWSTEVVDATKTIPTGLIEDHYLFLAVSGTDLDYFWADDITALPAGTLNTLYLSVNLGAGFGAASVFYTDSKLSSYDYLHNPNVTLLGSGQSGVLIDRILSIPVGEHGSQTGYIGFELEYPVVAYECLTSLAKNPNDVIDLSIDWTGFLNGDKLASFSCTAIGLTVSEVSFTDTTTTARLSGGTAGLHYYARLQITTDLGITEVKTVRIEVRECS